MSSKTLWFLLIIALLILGFIIYLAYFLEIQTKSIEVIPKWGESSSETFPELEQVIVPPPDYSGGKSDTGKPTSSDTTPSIPETEKLRIVGYYGIITQINKSSLEFHTKLLEGEETLSASIDADTKITQVFLGQEERRENIKFTDLQVGDGIMISGMARDWGEPILDTNNIERVYSE